jgi:hypothetical protein
MVMKIESSEQLIEYCNKNNRVCPEPNSWNELWKMLQNKTQIGNRWIPSSPLILAAWWDTPILMKKLRFLDHIEWANKNGQLREIANFLMNLSEDQWHHSKD